MEKKLLGKLGEGEQWASGTWDPRTIQVHASSWGRVSSSKEEGVLLDLCKGDVKSAAK